MEEFGVLLIAVDHYPDPPGPLPSSESARRLAAMVAGERGGALIDSVVARSQEDIWTALERWVATDRGHPPSTIVYLVGHGTDDGLDHSFVVPGGGGVREIPTASLASFLQKDWLRRQGDLGSWTLLVLDCCASEIGVTNLLHELTGKAIKRPRRLSLWPATPSGAAHSGSFVDALGRAIATFTENDSVIPLNELFRRMRSELGDLEPGGFLPDEAALRNPLRSLTPIVMNLDAHAELRRLIGALPDDVRNHFLSKAQGAESGELAWYFEGRQREVSDLCEWLRNAAGGMRVITGPAGSGKSALLGHLAVLADDDLVAAYAAAGLAPALRDSPRPPAAVFDATIHLTGKTLADVIDSVRGQIDVDAFSLASMQAATETPAAFAQFLRMIARPITVLADALDEAQEPMPIASYLRVLARSRVGRVVIGTRRSLTEGPDQPADPARRELLDALDAGADEIVEIEHDSAAIRRYIVHRLSAPGSPYAGDDETVRAIADRIAARQQPFLFARLATSELLARPPLAADAPEWGMLDEGHHGVFAAAVHRIGRAVPMAGVMLRALAQARGRGLPESGGVWVAVARAGAKGVAIPDTAVRTTTEAAAPYITLDAEGGQSVYRLAHRTFVEHYARGRNFGLEPGPSVGLALLQLVERGGGWATANYYCVRHLPQHLEAAMEIERLEALTTDAGWLTRAMELLGVDRTVEAISGGGLSLSPVAWVVQKALRRARIALSREPRQLAGQMNARLRHSSDDRLAGLGEALAARSPEPVLMMRHGGLDWMSDLETTYGLVGKVRALAFGRIDDRALLAIGVDRRIHLWDPLLGAGEPRVIDNQSRRVNALTFAAVGGRTVLIVASYYDDQIGVVRDAGTGNPIGEPFAIGDYVDSLAVGLLGNRLAIVASGGGRVLAWDFETRQPIDDLPSSLTHEGLVGVSEMEGRVVAHVVRPIDRGFGAWVIDLATGVALWSEPMPLERPLALVAAYSTRSGFFVTGCLDNGRVVTWSPKERREVYEFEARTAFDVPVRALAVTEVDPLTKKAVVALAPDYDDTTLVKLVQLDSGSEEDGNARPWSSSGLPWRGPEIRAAFALPDGTLAALTDSPVAVFDLTSDGAGPPLDPSPDPATVAFALTGHSDAGAAFTSRGNDGRARLTQAPAARRSADDEPFVLDDPAQWPKSATAWGLMGGRAVTATGSIAGAVWIWDAASAQPVAGPLTAVPRAILRMGRRGLAIKGGTSLTQSVALGRHPDHGDIVAIASDGRVRLFALPGGEPLPAAFDRATVITSVALGRIHDEQVLVTGSKGGALIVWGVASGRRIAALTLDHPIDRVWVVHGSHAIAAMARDMIHVLDVVPGAELA